MFTDEVLEKFFSDRDMQRIPVGCQSTAVRVFEKIVGEMVRDDEYATHSASPTDWIWT